MELTLALDAGLATAAPAPPAPGLDPNDPTAEAFAALLATLIAAVAPDLPVHAPVAAPAGSVVEVTATVVAPVVSEAPAAPVLPLALALPDAAPVVVDGAGAAPETPVPLTAAAIPLAPASSSPTGAASPHGRIDSAEPDVEAPIRADRPVATAVPTGAATVTPDAVAPVAARPFSYPSLSDRPSQPDQTSPASPIAGAPAVREILRPEIVSGPGAPAPTPPTPVEQVVRAVAPLRKLPDGTHNIVLELRPADLGVVRVELSLDRGMIHLGLQADTEGTSQLLRAALPELRSQLDTAGLLAGRLSVDDGGLGRNTEDQPSWRTDADGRRHQRDDADALPEEPAPTAYSSSAYGQVDVLL